MVVGLLAGAEVDVLVTHQTLKQYQQTVTSTYAPQTTLTLSPTFAPQQSMAYSPILQLGSPGATAMGAPVTQTPTVSPITVITPTLTPTTSVVPSMTAEQSATQATAGGGDLIQYAVLGGIALVAIWYLTKKKGKGKKKILGLF